MNQYVTGTMIRQIRERSHMTQSELAGQLNVSDKTVSKWENGKGYPDITLLEGLAKALNISVIELLSGNNVVNTNRSSGMLRSKVYVCPVCGNVIHSVGEALVCCHGINLPCLEPEMPDENHRVDIHVVEDEYHVEILHDMRKEHYISFIMGMSDDGAQLIKLYPEGKAEARLRISRTRDIYYYCNQDGLFKVSWKKR